MYLTILWVFDKFTNLQIDIHKTSIVLDYNKTGHYVKKINSININNIK